MLGSTERGTTYKRILTSYGQTPSTIEIIPVNNLFNIKRNSNNIK